MSLQNKNIFLIFCLSLLTVLISADNLVRSQASLGILEATVFVNEGPCLFYNYQLFITNGNAVITILDQNVTNYVLTFNKSNDLYFRGAKQQFIIVQEKKQLQTISYWVLQIQKTLLGFDLKSFPVNSMVDNKGFNLGNDYFLDSIIEYSQADNLLYVVLLGTNYVNIYEIDVPNQGNILISVGKYYTVDPDSAYIVGGNSHVLVQAYSDQFWIDTGKTKLMGNIQTTIYNKIDIQNLTTLNIYEHMSKVYDLIGSYFQYVSISGDYRSISTFLYSGYGDQKIKNEVDLYNSDHYLIFSDSYNMFVAVGDYDIYLTIIEWDDVSKKYIVFSSTLNNTTPDSATNQQTINIFKSAVQVVYNDHKLYLLTSDNFFVYGNATYFTKLYETNLTQPISQSSNLIEIIFVQIQLFQQIT